MSTGTGVAPEATTAVPSCAECNVEFGNSCLPKKPKLCPGCEALLCPSCATKYPLVPYDPSKPDSVDKTTKVETFCTKCYKAKSTIDFDRTYDIIGSDESATTLVMVHGGGGSRMMFRPHAERLAKEYGYRSILLDLPGHGSLVETPLTLDNCVETVQKVYTECKLDPSKTVYVGGSLGAYIGFYILSKMNDNFIGAVMIDCGQNVGPDASLKASLGCMVLKFAVNHMSAKQLMESMLGLAVKSPADYCLVQSSFGSGLFFQQGTAQVDCMHTVKPADHIPHYTFPVLYMNGSEDYRDSENKWLELCQKQEQSQLHVYQGGDHFFCHDTRFVSDILNRIDTFVKSALAT